MPVMVILVIALAFGLGLADRGWLAVVAAAMLPAVLAFLGAFDDGEGVGTFLLMSVVFAALASVGVVLSSGFKRLSGTTLSP